jgi:arsenical pump membrane protein
MIPIQLILVAAIFLVTLALIMVRPRGLSEAFAALGGGGAMLLIGAVGPGEAADLLAANWNVFGFFLGLMAIAALAEGAGFFDWLARGAARSAQGSGLRLFINIFLIGVLITVFLSNDATALILTPLVYTLVVRLRLEPLPFMFATTFIADTASFVLPVSNPINILVLQAFPRDLGSYLRHLGLAAALVIAGNILLFAWIFRRDVRHRFVLEHLGGETAPAHPRLQRATTVTLAAIAVAYVLAGVFGWPLSFVALAGAAGLVVEAGLLGAWTPRRWAQEIAWPIFGFIGGMLLVVRGVENAGITAAFGQALLSTSGNSPLAATLLTAGGGALGANLINNVPMALVLTSAIHSAGGGGPLQDPLVYATILGADLGPNITTIGSLATMLWLLILRRRGLEVSSLEYFMLGITVTPILWLIGALAIWLTL